MIEIHVRRDVPTTWPCSAPQKVPPWMTSTAWWPPGGDRQSRVCAGLSLLRVLPAAPVAWPGWRPPGAPWSCELNAGARSPWDLLRAGASGMVAELLLGHQSPWMLPRSIPGVLFHSCGLVGPPWVPKGVHSRIWVIGPHTHRGGGGVLPGSYIGRGAVRIIKSFFRAVFCGMPSSIGVAPT